MFDGLVDLDWECTMCGKEAFSRYVYERGGARKVRSEVRLCNGCVDRYELDKKFKEVDMPLRKKK
jgi:diaminopimelate epimerase